MTIEISKENRNQAIASIQRYFKENMEEEIGNISAGALLGFFLEEIGPLVYNKAVQDVQGNLERRVLELDMKFMKMNFLIGQSMVDRRKVSDADICGWKKEKVDFAHQVKDMNFKELQLR